MVYPPKPGRQNVPVVTTMLSFVGMAFLIFLLSDMNVRSQEDFGQYGLIIAVVLAMLFPVFLLNFVTVVRNAWNELNEPDPYIPTQIKIIK